MHLSSIMNVNLEAERVHIANHKWWINIHTGEPLDRDKGEQLMLVVTELSEAMEGARKKLMDDHLPQYPMEHVEIIDAFIRLLDYRHGHGFREEFNDIDMPENVTGPKSFGRRLLDIVHCVIAIDDYKYVPDYVQPIDWTINALFWYATERGFASLFREIYEAKLAYNATRVDHTIEHRLSLHGKEI